MAHGIFQYAEPAFIKEIGYWTDGSTKSGKKDAEEPVTPYGQTSASEDMGHGRLTGLPP